MSALRYWIWLSEAAGPGSGTAEKVLRHFGTPEKVFFARENELKETPGLTKAELAALCRKDLSSARRALDRCTELGLRVITVSDAEYPERLRNIPAPPVVLYVRGVLPPLDEEAAVAVVGTRSCTPYGLRAAEKMGYELAHSGCLLVTGLAKGIDSAAAKGALRAGGRVVGVVGCGLDIVYPRGSERLFDDVAGTGAILSEYPPGTAPSGRNFPVRNRILSGISLGVAVIEAPRHSGALITASAALEQGRDVFVMPGNVDSPASEGSNDLLREGALPVVSGWNIADEYRAQFPDKIKARSASKPDVPLDGRAAERLIRAEGPDSSAETAAPPRAEPRRIDLNALTEGLSDREASVVRMIGAGRVHVDDIIASSGLPASEVLPMLTMLELAGVVKQESGKFFTLPEN